MKPGHHRSKLHLVIVGLLLTGTAAVAAYSLIAPADEKVLREKLGTLRSSVSEALLLIHQDRSGLLHRRYFRTEMELLSRDLSDVAKSLQKARPKEDLGALFHESAEMAAAASVALEPLAEARPGPEAARDARARLPAIRARVLALETMLE